MLYSGMKNLIKVSILLFLTGCVGETLFTLGPFNFKQADIMTTPIKMMIKKDSIKVDKTEQK